MRLAIPQYAERFAGAGGLDGCAEAGAVEVVEASTTDIGTTVLELGDLFNGRVVDLDGEPLTADWIGA